MRTGEHLAEEVGNIEERGPAGDVLGCLETAAGEQSEGGAAGRGRVVKAGFEGEITVVETVGVECDAGAGGWAAEEVDGATLADDVDGPLPGLWSSDRFDDLVGAALAGGERANRGDTGCGVRAVDVGEMKDLLRPEEPSGSDLIRAFDHGDDMDTRELRGVHEHEAYGAGTENDHGVSRTGGSLLKAAYNAGERLSERGVFEGDVVWDVEGVLLNDARGDADVLGVGAVVEEEIFAEVLLVAGAEEAGVAGRRVEGDDAVSRAEATNAGASLHHSPGEFVAERDGRLKHHGVIPAAVDLEIGPARECGTDAEDKFTAAGVRNGNLLKTQIFLAVENRGKHLAVGRDRRFGERSHPVYFLTDESFAPDLIFLRRRSRL
jgi:hypothetical protein